MNHRLYEQNKNLFNKTKYKKIKNDCDAITCINFENVINELHYLCGNFVFRNNNEKLENKDILSNNIING